MKEKQRDGEKGKTCCKSFKFHVILCVAAGCNKKKKYNFTELLRNSFS